MVPGEFALDEVLAGAQRFLAGKAPDARSWFITLPGATSHGAIASWVPQTKEGEPPPRRRDNQATIGADGRVIDARVLRSIPLLDQAALDAVRQWEFTPTLLNGVATPIIMTVTVNFSLTEQTPQF